MAQQIPQLDLASLHTPQGARELDRACAEWGFFYLIGHDVDGPLRRSVMQSARGFFSQPTAAKNRIRRTDHNSWGFYDAELTKNRRDWKEILDIGPAVEYGPLAGSYPQWPDLADFRTTIETLEARLHAIALQLVTGIGQALNCRQDLTAPFVDHSSYIRLNFYPECLEPAPADADFAPATGHLGISHHTDAGAVTVLLQDEVPGLQVFKDGVFHIIEPRDGALVINVGDIVQVWSNDRYQAPLHRVLANSTRSRVSIPYFLNPSYRYEYAPLDSVVDPQHPARYRPINWGEFRSKRSAGDYADVGEEVQISHYAS